MFCRHFGFTADWENWSENDRMSPFPKFSFSLPRFVNFLLFLPRPNSPLFFQFQDGGLNIRWKYSTHPSKIRLHCRLPVTLYSQWLNSYIHILTISCPQGVIFVGREHFFSCRRTFCCLTFSANEYFVDHRQFVLWSSF